jgi:hypothetical protein
MSRAAFISLAPDVRRRPIVLGYREASGHAACGATMELRTMARGATPRRIVKLTRRAERNGMRPLQHVC